MRPLQDPARLEQNDDDDDDDDDQRSSDARDEEATDGDDEGEDRARNSYARRCELLDVLFFIFFFSLSFEQEMERILRGLIAYSRLPFADPVASRFPLVRHPPRPQISASSSTAAGAGSAISHRLVLFGEEECEGGGDRVGGDIGGGDGV